MFNSRKGRELGLLAGGIAVLWNSCSFSSVSTEKEVRVDRRTFGQLYYLPYGRIHITGTLSSSSKDTAATPTPSPSKSPASTPKSTNGSDTGNQDESAQSKEYTITVTEELQPDKDAPYYLDQRRNWAFDDENHFIVNKKYLLTTSNITAQDRSPDIIATTASLVVQATGFPGLNAVPGLSAAQAATKTTNAAKSAFTKAVDDSKLGDVEKQRTKEEALKSLPPTSAVGDIKSLLRDQVSNLIPRGLIPPTSQDALNELKNAIPSIVPSEPISELINSLGDAKYQGAKILTATLRQILESNHINVTPKIYALEQKQTASTEDVIGALYTVNNESIDLESEKILLSSFYKESKKTSPEQPKPFTVVFDPEGSGGEKGKAIEIMRECGFDLQVDPEKPARDFVGIDNPSDPKNSGANAGPFFAGNRINGVIYRPPKTYKISIKSLAGVKKQNTDKTKAEPNWDDAHILINQSIALPDSKRSLIADYARFAFVKRTTNIGFVDGMLVDYDQTTPSPVLGFLSIPKAIIQALLPIPSGSSSPKPSGGSSSGSSTL